MHSAFVVAEEFCRLARESTPNNYMSLLKLMELLYIAHGFKLATESKPLFTDEIKAWKSGPVVPSLYHYIRKHCYTDPQKKQPTTIWEKICALSKKTSAPPVIDVTQIPSVTQADLDSLLPRDKAIMAKIFAIYRKLDVSQVTAMTRGTGSPWMEIHDGWGADDSVIYDYDTKKFFQHILNINKNIFWPDFLGDTNGTHIL